MDSLSAYAGGRLGAGPCDLQWSNRPAARRGPCRRAPGFFRSKTTRATLERFGELGGPNDLKGAALLFASDAGGHITGQVLAVDGGATAV